MSNVLILVSIYNTKKMCIPPLLDDPANELLRQFLIIVHLNF
jgi:hypothetical protein